VAFPDPTVHDGVRGPSGLSAVEVLGATSRLAASFPGYEAREGQLAMAAAVDAALREEAPLFVEAGTGTGKTLAYLVPAILSGKKVIISTATRNLEEQIFEKDIPLVRRLLRPYGVEFRAALMKGLANYVCLRRLDEASNAPGGEKLTRIRRWSERTESGDRADLSEFGESDHLWSEVQSSSDTRIGNGCTYFDRCFVTKMRRLADAADIVVVNHHLFFADLALRRAREGYASALPNYDAVIFDEAHQIEDIATDFFGKRITSARIDTWLRDCRGSGLDVPSVAGIERAASNLWSLLSAKVRVGERRTLAKSDWSAVDRDAAMTLHELLRVFVHEANGLDLDGPQASQPRDVAVRRAGELASDLEEIVPADAAPVPFDDAPPEQHLEDKAPDGRITWLERKERSIAFGSSPVDLGGTLRRALFDRVPGVVCTSATLASGGQKVSGGAASFHFARARLGAPPETRELVVDSPFDYPRKAALYLTRDLPEPNAPGYDEKLGDRAADLIKLTAGGAFVLCTSIRSMKAVHARLERSGHVPGALFLQGTEPKQRLLERFRAAGNGTLVATMSFWEGVDVPGHALRLVILDKIPFAVPSDPLVMARSAKIEAEGGNAFAQYSVPTAALALKQGFGRLLRTATDYGIVAILDPRMVTRGYGKKLLAGLPPARVIFNLDELAIFYAGASAENPPPVPPSPRSDEAATIATPESPAADAQLEFPC
jgi:ATP-dependent DNA helicase DinG